MSLRIHVDTDLGTNPDDACALAMLLGQPEVTITGITTTADPGGMRAGLVHEVLALAGRRDLAVAAGAERTLTSPRATGDIPMGEPWWPRPAPRRPNPPGVALDLLAASLDAGATCVAIGPYTNLALLETLRPGSLAKAPIVLMGGWIGGRLPDGYPNWSAARDWNVRCDTRAARIVFDAAAYLTMVPIAATIQAPIRATDLPRMQAAGPLGQLLARQTKAYGDAHYADVGRLYPRLPDDLLGFHHDPLACAVATGWHGATVRMRRVAAVEEAGMLRFEDDPGGRPVRVVADVDAADFREHWFERLAFGRP